MFTFSSDPIVRMSPPAPIDSCLARLPACGGSTPAFHDGGCARGRILEASHKRPSLPSGSTSPRLRSARRSLTAQTSRRTTSRTGTTSRASPPGCACASTAAAATAAAPPPQRQQLAVAGALFLRLTFDPALLRAETACCLADPQGALPGQGGDRDRRDRPRCEGLLREGGRDLRPLRLREPRDGLHEAVRWLKADTEPAHREQARTFAGSFGCYKLSMVLSFSAGVTTSLRFLPASLRLRRFMTGLADSLGLGLGSVSDYCVCVRLSFAKPL